MFPYYGSKGTVIDFYPRPTTGNIIEPFAGSARYSLKHFENQVLLLDKYETIINLWKWLQQCSEKDIYSLPVPKPKQKISDFTFDCQEQENLAGFIFQSAQGKPAKCAGTLTGHLKDIPLIKKRIASQLFKIKHWKIQLGSFEDIPNQFGTWFIDPPYQFGGQHQYKFGNKNLDFQSLAEWCKTREGQIIVCENTKANWLPFVPISKLQGTNNTFTTEAIWTNYKTCYNNIQQTFF